MPTLTLPYPQEILREDLGMLFRLHCDFTLDVNDLLELRAAEPLIRKWREQLERRLQDQALETELN